MSALASEELQLSENYLAAVAAHHAQGIGSETMNLQSLSNIIVPSELAPYHAAVVRMSDVPALPVRRLFPRLKEQSKNWPLHTDVLPNRGCMMYLCLIVLRTQS